MKQYMHYFIILLLLIVTFLLYNKQLASIPLLLLSIYLFYFVWKEVKKLKNNK